MAKDPVLAKGVRTEFDKLQLARQVKNLREARHLSQADLAAKVGTKQPAIARIESGRGMPRLDFLQRIADALGARLDVKLAPTSMVTSNVGPFDRLPRRGGYCGGIRRALLVSAANLANQYRSKH